MGAALAVLIAAFRDVYPSIPIENESLGIYLIESNADLRVADAISIVDTIAILVRDRQNINSEKTDATYFMIAPDAARNTKFRK